MIRKRIIISDSIAKTGITNPQLHSQGIQELKAAISSISEYSENISTQTNKLATYLYVVIAIVLIALSLYLHNNAGILIGILGLTLAGITLPTLLLAVYISM